jgi:hypothetical protein
VPRRRSRDDRAAIAWLHWAQGKRAHAMAYIAEAQQIEPTLVLAYGLGVIITTTTPDWIHQ